MEEEIINNCSSMDKNEKEVENIGNVVGENVEERVGEPTVDMTFGSMEELIEYYRRFGNQMGFAVSKRYTNKDLDGVQRYTTIACTRSGTSKNTSKNTLKPYPITKTNCKARITAMLVMDGKWVVRKVFLDHNHVLSPGKTRYHRSNRVISKDVRRRLELNDRSGIRMSKSFQALAVEAGGYEKLDFSEKDCLNYIDKVRRLRFGEGDASAIQNYFIHVQATDSKIFYMLDLDEENRLKNLFWADGRQRAAYEKFGDVVTFDTTYLTNKYEMPFAPFVGVNHHGQSTLFGCGLLSKEDTETFTWLFKAWLACMYGRAPPAIITDQDRAMQNAIQIVFPNARHRWCLWHIMKKIPEKLSGFKKYEQIKYFLATVVYDSLTINEFGIGWNKMIEKYELQRNDWLNGLYNERHRWVPCFVKDCFWAGMSTTQRSESINAFFDKYVNSKTTLKQFVDQYENALADKVKKENDADYICFNSWIPTVSRYVMEKQIQDVYTTSKFKEFQEELTGKMYCQVSDLNNHGSIFEYEVVEDLLLGDQMRKVKFKVCLVRVEGEDCHIKFVCRLFEFRGILCRHAIAVLLLEGIYSIPSKYILRKWRKDIKRCHTNVRVSYSDWSVTDEGRRYNRMCKAFLDIADIASEFQEKCDFIMEKLSDLRICVTNNDGVCGSTGAQSTPNTMSMDLGKFSQGSKSILLPLAARRKGRPTFKRKQSRVDTIIQRKKKGNKNSSNMFYEHVEDTIGTQGSVVINHNVTIEGMNIDLGVGGTTGRDLRMNIDVGVGATGRDLCMNIVGVGGTIEH